MAHLPLLSVGSTLSDPKWPFTTGETLMPCGGVANAGVAIRDDAASTAEMDLITLSGFMGSLLFGSFLDCVQLRSMQAIRRRSRRFENRGYGQRPSRRERWNLRQSPAPPR